jgi:hypothetical protein
MMNDDFDTPSQASANPNSINDTVKAWGPTVVSAVGIVLTRNSPIVAALFAVALLGLAGVELMPLWKAWKQRRRERSRDAKTVADNLPKLRSFVSQFGRFFGGSSDTLHNIVFSGMSSTALRDRLTTALGTPARDFWEYLWTFSFRRTERPSMTLDELLVEVQEFNFLVSAYGNWCVSQVFDRLPQDVLNSLQESDRRTLNEFQQRHAQFLSAYETFLHDLSTACPATKNIGQTFMRSKPFSR